MAWTTPGTATAGDVLTAAFWNTNVRDNSNALYGAVRRLAYIERTTNYSITATTIATGTDMFSSDLTFTADGTSSYLVAFYAGSYSSHSGSGGVVELYLTDGGNNALGRFSQQQINTTGNLPGSGVRQRYYTPASGSRSINIRGIVNSGTGTLGMGDGVSTNDMPGYLAIFGPIIT